MYSGFAMVVVLAAAIRRGLGLQRLITAAHFDVMARILLFGALAMTLSYASEWFFAWYSGDRAERGLVRFLFTGGYAPFYIAMLVLNCLLPQAFWLPAARRSLPLILILAVLINLGMWLERILIVTATPSHGRLPSQWQLYWPTLWDWLLLAGALGFFSLMFFLFVRLVPAVSMHETRAALREAA
jgi:molybdopterin-containing oxidoreductase family membrane subunit